jgi:hypothetical protein
MSGHFPERTLNAVKARSPVTGHLLNLPLELRDIIYGMLLTTPYCTTDFDSIEGIGPQFHLETAILLVNKQISVESTRILYEGNNFIFLKVIGIDCTLSRVPAFKLLSENKITSPVLRIEFAAADASHVEMDNPQSLITAPEGLPSIIRALWGQIERNVGFPDNWIPYGDLRMTIDFNPKSASRYQDLSELVLRPWDQVNVKELVLKGDIKEPMREHLMKSNMEGPFPNDVAAHFEAYSSMAEKEFEQENYDAAVWWWISYHFYWYYISRLRPYSLGGRRKCEEDDGLCDILKNSYHIPPEKHLMLAKACLRRFKYKEALIYAYNAIAHPEMDQWEVRRFGPKLNAVIVTKLCLSCSLASVALEKTGNGMWHLEQAAEAVEDSGGFGNLDMADMNVPELIEDLKKTVDNELIRLESSRRCGRKKPLSLERRTGPAWQVGVVQRSFWEWMELPEGREGAQETQLG